uniref:Dihydrolipoyllysine-residue succinyltransferase component of 2-oxoglutarate dehydrogenase complex n=1 Tax=Lygus hesperus TaxID=30085 RepID=A0A0A9Z2G9_LYGHE
MSQKRWVSSVKCPALGDSILEGDVVEWKFKEGDFVKEDDILLVLETAKVVIDIPTPYTGVLRKIHIPAGSVSNVGDILCDIDTDAKGSSDAAASTVSTTTTPSATVAPEPAAIEPAVGAPAAVAPAAPAAPAAAAGTPQTQQVVCPTTGSSEGREDRRVKMTRMRQTIGKRLKEAQNT